MTEGVVLQVIFSIILIRFHQYPRHSEGKIEINEYNRDYKGELIADVNKVLLRKISLQSVIVFRFYGDQCVHSAVSYQFSFDNRISHHIVVDMYPDQLSACSFQRVQTASYAVQPLLNALLMWTTVSLQVVLTVRSSAIHTCLKSRQETPRGDTEAKQVVVRSIIGILDHSFQRYCALDHS